MANYLSGHNPELSTRSNGYRRPEVSASTLPVFVDGTGRRRRRVRVAAVGVGTACTAYVCTLVVALTAIHVNPFGLPDVGGAHALIQPAPEGRAAPLDGTPAGERDATAATQPIL